MTHRPPSRLRNIDPRRIKPLHRIKRKRDLRLLIKALREEGWRGRRLLVEQIRPGRYQAWTGTHRIKAAKRAKLRTVPVLLIDLKKWHRRWGYKKGLLAIDMVGCGHVSGNDEMKFVMLEEAGDQLSTDLMREEIEMNLCATEHGFV